MDDLLYDPDRRADILSLHSQMACPEWCTRPGCTRQDLLVEVTLLDLWMLAQSMGRLPSDLFTDSALLRLASSPGLAFRKRVVLGLRKPCPFLKGPLCSVYGARPLPCALFPENLALDQARLEAFGSEEEWQEYHCLRHLPQVSQERRDLIEVLESRVSAERFVTHLILFGEAPLLIDFREEAQSLALASSREDRQAQVVRHAAVEGLFWERLGRGTFIDEVRERMRRAEKDLSGLLSLVRDAEGTKPWRQMPLPANEHRLTPEGRFVR